MSSLQVGHAFHDHARGVIVGPYASSKAAMDAAIESGHNPENVTVALWTTARVWNGTKELNPNV